MATKRKTNEGGLATTFDIYYSMYSGQLRGIAEAQFDWVGLYEQSNYHIDPRQMETFLLEKGMIGFMKQDKGEIVNGETLIEDRFVALPASGTNVQSEQYNWSQFLLTGLGYQKTINTQGSLDRWTGVPCFDSLSRRNTRNQVIEMGAMEMAQIATTIYQNMKSSQKQRVFVLNGPESEVLAKTINQAIQNGDTDAIFASKEMLKLELQTLDFNITMADVLSAQNAMANVWDRIMMNLGIDNSPFTKRAEVKEAEVSANNEQIAIIRESFWRPRRYFAKQINKKFGLNISVEFIGGVSDSVNERELTSNE